MDFTQLYARAPLIRLLPPFIAGIIVASFLISWFSLFVFSAAVLLVFIFLLRRNTLRYRLVWLESIPVMLGLFLAAYLLTVLRMPEQIPQHILHSCGKADALLLRLDESPSVRAKTVRVVCRTEAVREGKWKAAEGKIMVYLNRDALANALEYGDQILVKAVPEKIPGPMNPGEFDYRRYLKLHGIEARVYASGGSWAKEQGKGGNFLKAAAIGVQQKLGDVFESCGLHGQELAVAQALLLGATDDLEPGLVQSYAASGTLHVLSVSGMHVAIIYLVLQALLGFLDSRGTYARWLKMILLLAFLWFYALVTGFSPSVMRSAAMLSFVIIGRSFFYRQNIWNILSASLFFLLAIDPLMLFDAGFQLSYLAVGSIVGLHPSLHSKLQIKNWFGQQAWTLVSVSIVAQVITFPVSLYYFQQFPVYFLIANLLVIPLSTLVIYGGLFLLLISPVKILAGWFGFVYSWFVHLLNGSVQMIESWPGAVAETHSFSGFELLLMYAALLMLLYFLYERKAGALQFSMLTLVFLLAVFLFSSGAQSRQQRLVFYSISKFTAIDCISGRTGVLLADSALLVDNGGLDFHIRPGWKIFGVDEHSVHRLQETTVQDSFLRYAQNMLRVFGKTIVIIGRGNRSGWPRGKKADIVLLTQNTDAAADSIIRQLSPALLVADASSGIRKRSQWKEAASRYHIPFRDLKEEGALVLEY